MEKLKKLIELYYPGYKISCIEEFFRPGRGWQRRINRKDISTLKTPEAYRKVHSINSSRICLRIINPESGEVMRPDVTIANIENPTI